MTDGIHGHFVSLEVHLPVNGVMREFAQSCTTFAFTMSLLSVELIDRITSSKSGTGLGATRALDSVSDAVVDQLGPRLRSVFGGLNEVQRAFTGIVFDLSLDLARNTVNLLADEGDGDWGRKRAPRSMIGSVEYPE